MEISEILHELERLRGYFPETAVREASKRREEITPHLLRMLEETVANADAVVHDGDYMGHLYAMYLLAQFRETAAYPLLIRYARLPGELPHDLGGDLITEDFRRILASVCGGDITPIKALVEDGGLDEYVRGAALDSLVVLVACGSLSRDEVIDYYRSLSRGGLEREHSLAWDSLVSCILDLHPEELMEEIHEAYRAGLVDERYVSLANVKDSARRSKDKVLLELRSVRGGLIDDVVAEMEEWACFKEERAESVTTSPKPSPKPNPKPSTPSLIANPSRTRPCPCGSGRKYKKCCGKGK